MNIQEWLRRRAVSVLALVSALALTATPCVAQRAPPLSVDGLSGLRARPSSLHRLGDVDGAGSFKAYLVSYRHAGLLLYALVAVPVLPPPPTGYPVLIANHGYHPDPPRYGITPEGRDWRPGNYYRSIPAAYAAAGFLVVMPDYRGHNRSEGGEYTSSMLASAYYAEDVVALLGALPTLEQADTRQVFMWGHSMGGPITLQVLVAASGFDARVRGASVWASAGGTFWERAYRQSRMREPLADDRLDAPKPAMQALAREIAGFSAGFAIGGLEPVDNLAHLAVPVMLHHATGDPSTDYAGSARIAAELQRLGKPYVFYSYPGADHFFTGAQFEAAVARDVAFFRQLMRPADTH